MLFTEKEKQNKEMIASLKEKTHSKAAKDAIDTADELADMILFHKKVKYNAKKMAEFWEM